MRRSTRYTLARTLSSSSCRLLCDHLNAPMRAAISQPYVGYTQRRSKRSSAAIKTTAGRGKAEGTIKAKPLAMFGRRPTAARRTLALNSNRIESRNHPSSSPDPQREAFMQPCLTSVHGQTSTGPRSDKKRCSRSIAASIMVRQVLRLRPRLAGRRRLDLWKRRAGGEGGRVWVRSRSRAAYETIPGVAADLNHSERGRHAAQGRDGKGVF